MRTILDREARRQQILDAATHVFARKGYRHASVTDVIEAAGIARGTFYLYFEGKEAVFLALIDQWFEEVSRYLEQYREISWSPESAQNQQRRYLRGWFEYLHKRRELAQIVYREAVAIDERFEERTRLVLARLNQVRGERVRRLQGEGYFRADLDVRFFNACVNGMLRELMLEFILPYPEPDLDRLVDQLFDFIYHGAVAPRSTGG